MRYCIRQIHVVLGSSVIPFWHNFFFFFWQMSKTNDVIFNMASFISLFQDIKTPNYHACTIDLLQKRLEALKSEIHRLKNDPTFQVWSLSNQQFCLWSSPFNLSCTQFDISKTNHDKTKKLCQDWMSLLKQYHINIRIENTIWK